MKHYICLFLFHFKFHNPRVVKENGDEGYKKQVNGIPGLTNVII